jgi:hypothetical protein
LNLTILCCGFMSGLLFRVIGSGKVLTMIRDLGSVEQGR